MTGKPLDHLNESLQTVFKETHDILKTEPSHTRICKISVYDLLIVSSACNRANGYVAANKSSIGKVQRSVSSIGIQIKDIQTLGEAALTHLTNNQKEALDEDIIQCSGALLKICMISLETSYLLLAGMTQKDYRFGDLLLESMNRANLVQNFQVKPKD